jgi:RNA polymerase sigma-70 factor (ECF subfamily)
VWFAASLTSTGSRSYRLPVFEAHRIIHEFNTREAFNVPDTADNSNTDSSLELPAVTDEFVQMFTKSQRRLFLFILSQVGNPVDAEEILQETNIVVWKKCNQFQLGTNFQAWVSRIATYEVLKQRDRKRRDRLYFSDEFVQQIAQDALIDTAQSDARRQALTSCLGKLRSKDRELIQRRYTPGENGKSVAEFLQRPVNSVYQSLGRIRRTLLECINRRLAAETGQ